MNIIKLFIASSVLVAGVSLTSCSDKNSTASTPAEISSSDSSAVIEYTGRIAYVRMDSLMRSYGMYVDLSGAFNEKQEKANAEMTRRGKALEREAMDYQTKMQQGTITTYQASTIEEGLHKKQQDLMAYRDKMMQELGEEEVVMSNSISVAVMDYLKVYNAEKKYSMIFQTTAGTPVLIADPALDITAEVLAELNKRYLADKAKEQK